MRLAKEVGLPQGSQSDLYYALLMKDAGWSSCASPPVRTHGREFLQYGLPPVPKSFFDRVHALVEAPAGQNKPDRELVKIRSVGGASVARRMGLPEAALSAIRSQDERWNGEGGPDGLQGEEIPLPARIIQLAQTLDMLYTAVGQAPALDSARQRSGSWFDPDLVRAADSLAKRGALWTDVAAANWRVIELEPCEKPLRASEAAIDNICRAFGEVVDAKSPFTHRHSMGVAGTAVFIARMLGMPESDVNVLRRASLLHDIGKLGVSNIILEKPGKLTADEWTTMSKHP
jgi:HD-GYP domain-containing protein (c-di-GMP phosphodiesterase class II)